MSVYPPSSGYPFTGDTVTLAPGVERVGDTVQPVLGTAVAVSAGAVEAVLASPASVEASGGSFRAKLDPATSAVNTRGASGVVTAYTAYTRINGASIDVKAPLFHKVELTAPLSTLDPNTLNPTITAQGNGYRIALTTQATARDGADEGWRGRFAVKDYSGATVDLTTFVGVVVVEVRRIASTVGAQITVSAGLSTRATTTGGQHALAGYCTGLATLQRNLVTTTSGNSASNDASLDTVRCVFVCMGNAGTYQLPGGIVAVYSAADAINSETQFTSQSDASPGTVGLSVLIGTDGTTAGLTDSTDVEIYACAYPIPAVGL